MGRIQDTKVADMSEQAKKRLQSRTKLMLCFPKLPALRLADMFALDREFETQSVDPMALEPESGLAW
jgi:hypothetical protein